MEQMSETLKLKFPVYYLADDGIIYDSDNEWVCDVDDPINDPGDGVISARGEFIANAINEKFERMNAEAPALEVGSRWVPTMDGEKYFFVDERGHVCVFLYHQMDIHDAYVSTGNVFKHHHEAGHAYALDRTRFIDTPTLEAAVRRLLIEKGQSNGA